MFIIQRVTLDAERTGKQIIPAMIGGRVRECHVGRQADSSVPASMDHAWAELPAYVEAPDYRYARIHENGNYGTFGVSQFPFSIDLWYFIGLSYRCIRFESARFSAISAKLSHDGGLDLFNGTDAVEGLQQPALFIGGQQRSGFLGIHIKTLGDGFRSVVGTAFDLEIGRAHV